MLRKYFGRVNQDETGGIAIFGLYIFVAMAIMAGVAIDVSNLVAAKTQLQVTADMAAHAALYSRDTNDREAAIAAALDLVEVTMPAETYGTVLTDSEIIFGDYDEATDTFTADKDSKSAVLIETRRLSDNANAVSSLLLQLAGIADWDVAVQSLFVTFRPTCFREGFVADGVVDIQSNNGFSNGFCIHSNSYVSINSNNTFEAGTIVSMPDTEDLDLPNSGWRTNDGLDLALREGAYRMRIINKLEDIILGLATGDPEYRPDYIIPGYFHRPAARNMYGGSFASGAVHIVTCLDRRLEITGTDLRHTVIIADCPIKFDNGMVIEDSVIATTDTSDRSISAASGLVLGANDGCAEGGGVQLITLGGMNFAADLSVYGSQLLAEGDIEFAANAEGIEGASMIAGGTVSGTSNMNMGFCGAGMESNFEAEYFRLAL